MGCNEVIVLDTCAIIWDALDTGKLTTKAKKAIDAAEANNELAISDISIWEIAMLIAKSRIQIDETSSSFINAYLQYRTISVLPISPEIAELSVNLGSDVSQRSRPIG